MEPVPDMDDLLDEIENSEPFSVNRPTSNILEAQKMVNEKTKEDDRSERELVLRPYSQLTQTTVKPQPQYVEEPSKEKTKISEKNSYEEEEKEDEPTVSNFEPLQKEHETISENTDFDEALERYLEQFSDEEDDQPKEDKPARDELIQVAESVADTIVSNAIMDCESDLIAYSIAVAGRYEEKIEQVTQKENEEVIEDLRDIPDETREEPIVEKDKIREDREKEETLEEEQTKQYKKESETKEEEHQAEHSELTLDTVVGISDVETENPEGSKENERAVDVPENSIATFHSFEQESSSSRLTESELLLGKQKPYWIPDNDCDLCMLCSSKFSLISRRHHCRACGRVLCNACCSERAVLEYMKTEDETKKPVPARVCHPCIATLAKIEEYVKERAERAEETSIRMRGVLKSRSEIETEQEPSNSDSQPKRSVTFRDGVNPGSSSGNTAEGEKSTAIKPKKKSRKRPSVVRRVTELRLEDELTSYLPDIGSQQLLVRQINGSFVYQTIEDIFERVKEDVVISIVVRKNLFCSIQATTISNTAIWAVISEGFLSIGLDELLFVWKREEDLEMTEVLTVLERISQIFRGSLDGNSSGVQQVSNRFPSIQSASQTVYPLPKHIYFYRPVFESFGPIRTPMAPFLVACFLADCELSWIMTCPNRVLFRLASKYGVYPFPLINYPNREAVFSAETTQTVLKVFTDFRNWSFRMATIPGSTLTLTNETTILKIPRDAQTNIKSIISWNRSMLAWCCDVNLAADSHLVCEENDGLYTTHVLSKGTSHDTTGASFVILDGGLKTSSQLQVSVVEDGVAIRVQAEQFRSICEALSDKQPRNMTVKDAGGSELRIEWVDNEHNIGPHAVKSPIDGLFLENKFQYGLSLERVLTTVFEVQSILEYCVRLSHVYNLHEGRLSPDDEPKVFSIVEVLSRECTSLLGPFLALLVSMEISSTNIRFFVFQDNVEYDVSPWLGLEQEQAKYRESMDQMIPILCNAAEYVSNGLNIEFTLTFVSSATLPSPSD